eukprot:TRINITY_DN16087_c0_g1_i1.p2 TRINITY_DN16087_c0_g1~~TRINITY_DN16087_c0_g1_i1.p2  ORF type:complete len:113 (+),score=13.61 TRINITY_DN16087_c0_g1_i1:99-437(+)
MCIRDRYMGKLKKQTMNSAFQNGYMSYQLFEDDKELRTLIECQTHLKEFRQEFNRGFNFYLNGQWGDAKKCLEVCLNYVPNDGPSNTILHVLKESDYICPADWKGYRELTEK